MTTKNLTKKASFNAFASIIDYGARGIVEFLITPLLVTGLGNYLYGLWRILWRLDGYMDAAGGRSAQALKWIVAKHQTSTNYDEKRRYIGGAVAVWLLFLPFLLMIGGLLVWFIPVLLDVPAEFLWSVRLAIGLLVLNVIVIGVADIPRAVLQGENLGYKRMGLSALLVFVGGALTALAVYFNLGLIGVAAATVATTFLTGLMFLWVVRRYVPWFGITKPSFETLRLFFGLSWWFVVWKFVMQLMLAGDILILGIFASIELVTIYSLTKYIPETLIRLVGMVVFGIAPGLGGVIGAGNLEKAIRVRDEIMSFTWLLITVAGATILLWNQLFVQLWVGPEYYAGLIPTLLIIVMVAQLTLIRNDANVIDLTLNVRSKVLIGLLAEILSLFLAALFISHFKMGIVGLCVGYIVGRSIISLAYPWLVGRFLEISLYAQFKSALWPVLITSLLFMMMLSLINFQSGNTWFTLVFGSGITVVVIFLTAFYVGLSNNQRRRLLKRIKTITQRNKLN